MNLIKSDELYESFKKRYSSIGLTLLSLPFIGKMFHLFCSSVFNKPKSALSFIITLVLCIVVFKIANIIFTYIHEYTHKLIAKLFNHQTVIDIKIQWKTLKVEGDPICKFQKDELIERNPFIMILISPFLLLVLFTILLLALNIPFSINSLIIYSTLYFLLIKKIVDGCSSDIYMLYKTLKFSKKTNLLRYIDRSCFEVI